MENRLTVKMIKKILDNKDSCKKISLILSLRQQERFLNTEKERLMSETKVLENEVTAKYKLGFIDVMLLVSVLEKKGYVNWYKKFLKEETLIFKEDGNKK